MYKIRRSQRLLAVQGFTILEILVAVILFALVVTTLFGSFRSSFSQVDVLDREGRLFDMAKNCLDRIQADLSSLRVALQPAYKAPTFGADPDPYRLVGEIVDSGGRSFSQLRFTTLAHLQINPSRPFGIAEVVYYVDRRADGSYLLKRSDRLYPYEPFEPRSEDPVLCIAVDSLRFGFYDDEGTRHDSWDSESDNFVYATPMAIDVQLELRDGERRLKFQTMVALPLHRSAVEPEKAG